MFRNNNRYDEYYLVNDMEIEDNESDVKKSWISRRTFLGVLCFLGLFSILLFVIIFVILPLVFMLSINVQRLLIFTRFNLPDTETYFETYRLPGYRNKYVTIKDLDGTTNKSLGVWQMLPVEFTFKSLHESDYDFEEALLNSNYSVLIYFHGTGESRSDNTRKYQLLRFFFHVIAFDYRGYGDSSKGVLSEKEIVNDCIQLYEWVLSKTNSPIYIWGHSLGSALAASTAAALEHSNYNIKGLILESAFTSLRDELYAHPFTKFLSWLPWFEATIVKPLNRNGFVFDTAKNILTVSCPIMILHAEDDRIVPYRFGEKLYQIASNRLSDGQNITIYHQFEKRLGYDHYFIYQDPYVKYYIMDFVIMAEKKESNNLVGNMTSSHQRIKRL